MKKIEGITRVLSMESGYEQKTGQQIWIAQLEPVLLTKEEAAEITSNPEVKVTLEALDK